MKQKLSKIKAQEMLKNPPHGISLTDKQLKYFHSVVDGTNTYEQGGWLDKYDTGGKMQEYQPNFNNSSVSIPQGFVGQGETIRNWKSGSWNGQFEDGGQILPYEDIPSIGAGVNTEDYRLQDEFNLIQNKLIKSNSLNTTVENKHNSERLFYSDINSPILDYILQQGIVNKDTTPNIRIEDKRDIDSTKKFNYNVSTATIKKLIAGAKSKGLNPNTVLAMALQETGINSENPLHNNSLDINIKDVEKSNNWDLNYHQINNSLDYLKQKMKYAKQLGKTTDADTIQSWNGYGKLNIDDGIGNHHPRYGISEKDNIDMNKDPVYGKRIIDLRDNVIKQNPKIQELINPIKKSFKNGGELKHLDQLTNFNTFGESKENWLEHYK